MSLKSCYREKLDFRDWHGGLDWSYSRDLSNPMMKSSQ